jgi:hypothetical protein
MGENGIRQCEKLTKSGARCRANAVSDSTACFAHSEALAEKRAAARRRGGEHKQRAVLGPDSPEISLRSGSQAIDLAGRMIDLVLHGQIDPRIANAAGGLLNLWLRAYAMEILEQRIAALEAAQNRGPRRPPERPEGAEPFGALGERS